MTRPGASAAPPVERLEVAAYTIPTETPESDGTLEWDSTTLVLVHAFAGGVRGLGYSYADAAAAQLIRDRLAPLVQERPALDVSAAWTAMIRDVRNVGRPGLGSMAIAAVDGALWDLKARLLGLPLASLLGAVRREVPVYASGGFTSYPTHRLCRQLADWVGAGIPRVKMKVGRDPKADVHRVRSVREAIGPEAELFVDANGAYDRQQALALAGRFAESGVSWLEEPVSSQDLRGLRWLRNRVPAGMEIAAGEYCSSLIDFRRMLEADAVDVLMPDATRCAGITGFLAAGALCEAFSVPASAHTAPSMHLHACCAVRTVRHLEWFHDHVRIERMLFEGVAEPVGGALAPDLTRAGNGLEFRGADAARFAA